MTIKAGDCTPVLHVRCLEDSIAFYERLGFETVHTDGASPLGWARLHCTGGALMFLLAEEPTADDHRSVLFYLYTNDLPGFRDQLIASGVTVPAIRYPDYMPSGEIMLKDPDGYTVFVGHWGKKEQQEWEKHLTNKPQE